mmetsp:Transcript_31747/g.54849  ORF Transcript_31747/g.54849 Transcript_31747/m.54849 type:complete len:277 (-) Transcript_31747:17-847(-)
MGFKRWSVSLIKMLIFLLLGAASATWWKRSNVLTLTQENFADHVGYDQHVLVEYFTPWCHWCRKFYEDWEQVWTFFNGPESETYSDDVLICRVNAEDYPKLAHSQDVFSFPTVLYYAPGQTDSTSKYKGKRSAKNLIDWIQSHSDAEIAEDAIEVPEEDLEVYEEEYGVHVDGYNDDTDFQDNQFIEHFEVLEGSFSQLHDTQAKIISAVKELSKKLTKIGTGIANMQQGESEGKDTALDLNPNYNFAFLLVGLALGGALALVASKLHAGVKHSKV